MKREQFPDTHHYIFDFTVGINSVLTFSTGEISTLSVDALFALESVRKVHTGLQSFRSIRRIDASCRNASALRLRFSKSLARRRQRLSHAKVRSTTQRIGRTTKPFV